MKKIIFTIIMTAISYGFTFADCKVLLTTNNYITTTGYTGSTRIINIFEYASGYDYRAFAKATNSKIVGTCNKQGLTEADLYKYIRKYKTSKDQPTYMKTIGRNKPIKRYTYMRNYQTDMTCDVVREAEEIYTNTYSLGELPEVYKQYKEKNRIVLDKCSISSDAITTKEIEYYKGLVK